MPAASTAVLRHSKARAEIQKKRRKRLIFINVSLLSLLAHQGIAAESHSFELWKLQANCLMKHVSDGIPLTPPGPTAGAIQFSASSGP